MCGIWCYVTMMSGDERQMTDVGWRIPTRGSGGGGPGTRYDGRSFVRSHWIGVGVSDSSRRRSGRDRREIWKPRHVLLGNRMLNICISGRREKKAWTSVYENINWKVIYRIMGILLCRFKWVILKVWSLLTVTRDIMTHFFRLVAFQIFQILNYSW